MKVKCTMVKPPYEFRTIEGYTVYDYHSAYTAKNPNWQWWKPWIERFISVPAGWRALFSIKGNIELSEKPSWHYSGDVQLDMKRPKVKFAK